MFSKDRHPAKFKFEMGDQVRISKQRLKFEKSYLPGWSEEIFTVSKRNNRQARPVYKLNDYNREEIFGSFYEVELQIVRKTDNVYRVERVIRKRRKNGKIESLVKWLGVSLIF